MASILYQIKMKLVILDYITGKVNIYNDINKEPEAQKIMDNYNKENIKYMVVNDDEFEIIHHE